MEINLKTISFYDFKSESENKFNSNLYQENKSNLDERMDPYDLDILIENNTLIHPQIVSGHIQTTPCSACCETMWCASKVNC